MSEKPFLWSVRLHTRLIPKWEAWIESPPGRVVRYTFDWAWTENRARSKALKRWRKMQLQKDVSGTRKGTPVE